jgi:DNA end-binding protein Ku
VRKPKDIFADIEKVEVEDEMLDIAAHIIDRKKMKFDPSQFEDKYEEALAELIEAKKAGHKPPAPKPAERPSNVINLFDALKKSLASAEGGAAETGKPSTRRKPAARSRPAAARKPAAKSKRRKSA